MTSVKVKRLVWCSIDTVIDTNIGTVTVHPITICGEQNQAYDDDDNSLIVVNEVESYCILWFLINCCVTALEYIRKNVNVHPERFDIIEFARRTNRLFD